MTRLLRKFFSRWNVQLLDELLFGTHDVFIGRFISCFVHNYRLADATRAMKLHYNLFHFLKRYLLYVLSFMSFVLPFFFVVYVICRFLSFLIVAVCLSFFSVIFQ